MLSEEIENILKQCMDLKDKKQCLNCHKEIDKNMNFCPECGAKQEEPAKEVEVLDRLEKVDSNIEKDDDSQENLEKTVEMEINPDTENVDEDTKIEEEEE